MLGTLLLVEVDHIRWNLEALLSPSSQGIDPIEEILLHLSSLKTVTLDIILSDLGVSSIGLRVTLL